MLSTEGLAKKLEPHGHLATRLQASVYRWSASVLETNVEDIVTLMKNTAILSGLRLFAMLRMVYAWCRVVSWPGWCATRRYRRARGGGVSVAEQGASVYRWSARSRKRHRCWRPSQTDSILRIYRRLGGACSAC